MADPTAADVAALLGITDPGFLSRADAALANGRALAVGYTRWPAPDPLPADLVAAVVSAAARL